MKSITLHISQSASALHEQFSSHFFKSSHNLKFLNCLNSLLIASKSEAVAGGGGGASPTTNCYPFCHMNTSCCIFISSSNVTCFSLVFRIGILITGASPVATDKSNSLTLRGTKYSTSGSLPATAERRAGVFRWKLLLLLRGRLLCWRMGGMRLMSGGVLMGAAPSTFGRCQELTTDMESSDWG